MVIRLREVAGLGGLQSLICRGADALERRGCEVQLKQPRRLIPDPSIPEDLNTQKGNAVLESNTDKISGSRIRNLTASVVSLSASRSSVAEGTGKTKLTRCAR
jgi:hypothetical protein